MMNNDKSKLLKVNNLRKYFPVTRGFMRKTVGTIKAVDGINFYIKEGETLALVGESGCGKTTIGRCILRAIEPTSGDIHFRMNTDKYVDIMSLDEDRLKKIRRNMRMIFQDPYSSLNPRMSVLEIMGEPFIIHKMVAKRRELEERVANLLRMVKLDPEYMRRYPHAFSGGQRQRIAIARVLALQPKFIVADEPVSALDVSVQAQILNLLKELQGKFNLTYLFIAHNLAVVKYISERVAIMYVGKIVELADTQEAFLSPKHPYTEALLSAIPIPDPQYRNKKRIVLGSEVANPSNPPSGCYFHPRCRYAKDTCRHEEPSLVNISRDGDSPHYVACHFANKLKLRGIKG